MTGSVKTIALKGATVFQHGMTWPGRPATVVLQGERIIDIVPADHMVESEKTIQLPGGILLPAFFDAHIHMDQGGRYLGMLQLRDITDPKTVLSEVKKATAAKKVGWLIGIGLRENAWPSLHDLHQASRGRPCLLYTRDYHTAFVNRESMLELSLKSDTPLPEGGWVDLDESGQPNGVLHENAVMWAERQLPLESLEQQRDNILRAQDYLLQLGIAGVSDAGHPDSWKILKALNDEGELEVYVEQWLRCLDFGMEILKSEQLRSERLNRFRIKLFIDGALGSRTAWMKEAYSDKPGWSGEPVPKLDVFDYFVEDAVEAGWGLTIHAIGDAGVEHVARRLSALPHGPIQHRMEHIQHADPEMIDLLKASQVVSSVQPLHRIEDKAMLLDRVGVERSNWAFPLSSLRQIDGSNLVVGTDWPVVSVDPRETMRASLLPRQSGEGMIGEELTVEEALLAYSLAAARVAGFGTTGDIQMGMDANLVWMRDDPGRDPSAWAQCDLDAIWRRGKLVRQELDF